MLPQARLLGVKSIYMAYVQYITYRMGTDGGSYRKAIKHPILLKPYLIVAIVVKQASYFFEGQWLQSDDARNSRNIEGDGK